MKPETLVLLINEISTAASQLISKLMTSSGLSEEELRQVRDQLSAETHALIKDELDKLDAGS